MPDFPKIPEAKMREMLAYPEGQVRLIVDTDAHNEIDDQFAIAWALLSQDKFKIEGMLAEPYSFQHHQKPLLDMYDDLKANPDKNIPIEVRGYAKRAKTMLENGINPHEFDHFAPPSRGMELSYEEILKVYDLLDEDPTGKVFRGSPDYLSSLDEPIQSEATDFLIERAMAADEDSPVYVAAIGCVTNIASAILLEPEIITRMVVLWTSSYPTRTLLNNRPSLNLMQDVIASQVLFNCGVPHVYLPGYYIGEQLKVSLPDMEAFVRGKSKIGDYLYHLYTHNPIHPMLGVTDHYARTWVIWDLINFAWLLDPSWVSSHITHSPILTDDLDWQLDSSRHLMREAHGIDRDAIFRDLFRKMEQAP